MQSEPDSALHHPQTASTNKNKRHAHTEGAQKVWEGGLRLLGLALYSGF